LPPNQVQKLLTAANIPTVKEVFCTTFSHCLQAIKKLQYPVVMKVVGPIHKSDVGGIILNITSDNALKEAFSKIIKISGATGVLLQQMKKGTELFIGSKRETNFGHLVLCGLGGIYIEVLKDVQTSLVPVSKNEAIEMIQNLKSFKILKGIRNQEGVNIQAFSDIITKVSTLVTIAPEIIELDLNPLLGNAKEIIAVDARICVDKTNIY
jgi:acetyltransferase